MPSTQHPAPRIQRMIEDPLPIGTIAPATTLTASDGSVVTLARVLAEGRALFAFYPGNHTPMCDRQLRELKDEIARYRSAGVTPYGVNPAGVAEHREYAASLELPYLLLSDPGLVAAKAWHAASPDGAQVTRTVYVVDRDGTIRFSARGMPGAEIILEAFEEG